MIWEHPFSARLHNRDKRMVDVLSMHVFEPLPLPPSHVVPSELSKIALRGAAKNPHDRLASMAEFADALRRFLASPWKLGDVPAGDESTDDCVACLEEDHCDSITASNCDDDGSCVACLDSAERAHLTDTPRLRQRDLRGVQVRGRPSSSPRITEGAFDAPRTEP